MPRSTEGKAGRRAQHGARFPSEVLADNLRDLRSLNHLSQPQVVERMSWLGHEWGPSTVSEVERGRRNVTTNELLALALVYGRTVNELLDPAGVTGEMKTPVDLGVQTPVKADASRTWLAGGLRIKLAWDIHRARWVTNDGDESPLATAGTSSVDDKRHAFIVSAASPRPQEWAPTDQDIFVSVDEQTDAKEDS